MEGGIGIRCNDCELDAVIVAALKNGALCIMECPHCKSKNIRLQGTEKGKPTPKVEIVQAMSKQES